MAFMSRSLAVTLAATCLAWAALAATKPPATGPAAPVASAEWHQWRGANRDGKSAERGLLQQWPASGPALVFSARGLGQGFSSVALQGGRIFTLGDRAGQQQLLALDAKDGRLLWATRVGPVWEDQYGGPRGTPTVDGDLVYALGSHGDLVCVEVATGKERWRRHMERDFGGQMMSMWKWSESPLVDGPRLVVTPGVAAAGLVALDKLTGREHWRAALPALGPKGRDGAAYSSIVISQGAGVKQYVQLLGRGLVGVRASDGRVLWTYNRVANEVANIATPVVDGEHVFASTGYQTGSVLLKLERQGDGVAAREAYYLEPTRFQNQLGGFVLVDGHIYGGHGHNRGFPICIELASGRIVWGGDIRNDGTGSAAVAQADGRLYLRYQNGVVLLVEATPTGYREQGRLTIPDVRAPSWPAPVISGGRLYLREQDSLHVYDLRAS
jgi:outer membrane protein assembly factor BamB